MDVFIPALPAIKNAFNASQQSTQLLISVYVFALSIGQLISGPFIDRYGCQNAFKIGIVLCFITSANIVFSESIELLVFLRFLQGLGAGTVTVAVFSSVPKIFKKELNGKVFSIFSGVLSVVPVLAPVLGSVLTSMYNWETCFLFLSVYMVFCMLVNWLKPFPRKLDNSQGDSDTGFTLYKKLLSTRSFIIGCVACSLGFSTQLAFFSTSPLVIIEQFSTRIENFGFFFGINALSITVGSLLALNLIGRLNEEVIIKAASAITLMSGISFNLHYFSDDINIWHFLLPSCFGSFGFALLMSAGTALCLNDFSCQSGRASSLNGALQLIIASVLSWLVMNFWDSEWLTIKILYVFCGLIIFGTTLLPKSTQKLATTHI
ncbi:TPA: MFS transporter [Aeromonas veronii]|nr:MFS transporter [Aeromonas veronii]